MTEKNHWILPKHQGNDSMEEVMTTLEEIEKYQLVVVIRTKTPDEAYKAAQACLKGGVKLIEITFSVPEAEDVIKRLSSIKGITVGAGTVLSVSQAKKAIKNGASFVVSPHLDEEIVRFTKSQGMVSVPGASTPTEILKAHLAGADIIKLFPFVEMGGLSFLKTIRGPLPFIKYMPSGGVTLDNVKDYLNAKVSGIIVGSAIASPELVKAKNWEAITGFSKRFVEKIRQN